MKKKIYCQTFRQREGLPEHQLYLRFQIVQKCFEEITKTINIYLEKGLVSNECKLFKKYQIVNISTSLIEYDHVIQITIYIYFTRP